MAENTKIQWATHTFSPWRERPNGTRVVAAEATWRQPAKWNLAAECECSFFRADGEHVDACPQTLRPRVFCASLADVFEDWRLPVVNSRGDQFFVHADDSMDCAPHGRQANLDDVRARLFRLIDATPNLDWLLLTKRPENVRRMWREKEPSGNLDPLASAPYGHPLRLRRDNVWLGTSIACQEDADRNVPELIKCRDLCAKTFLSIEPLVGPVDLTKTGNHDGTCANRFDGNCLFVGDIGGDEWAWKPRGFIDWVIVGGESGPNARPCNVEWIRAIVRQCRDAGVPCFVKQLGAYCLDNDAQSRRAWPLAVPMTLRDDWTRMIYRDPKGGDLAEWPEDLRVREVPA